VDIFILPNPYSHDMADSASNRKEHKESLGNKKRRARKADNLAAICEPNI
jgi:hypothetical protein